MEFLLISVIVVFIVLYRMNTGAVTYKFIVEKVGVAYDKFAPYSFKITRYSSSSTNIRTLPPFFIKEIIADFSSGKIGF